MCFAHLIDNTFHDSHKSGQDKLHSPGLYFNSSLFWRCMDLHLAPENESSLQNKSELFVGF